MSFRDLRCRALIIATIAALPAGCSDNVEMKKVAPSEITVVKQENRAKAETTPRKGSSAGMNYNPGGPPPNKSADVD